MPKNVTTTETAWAVARDALPWPANVDPETVSDQEAGADARLTPMHLIALRLRKLRDAVRLMQ